MKMKKHEIRLGNIFGATGGSFAGMVYAVYALAPALNTMGGGGRQPHVVVKEVRDDLCEKHSCAPG